MNCAICKEPFEEGLAVQIVNGEAVHRACHIKRKQEEEEMARKMQEAVETEYSEVTTENQENTPPQPKCEIVVGMEENGDLYFLARGSEPSLLNIEGLLKYAHLRMDAIWQGRMESKSNEGQG